MIIRLRSFKNHRRKVFLKSYSDREEVSANIKFNDAGLIGISHQVIMSEKLVADGKMELKSRIDENN